MEIELKVGVFEFELREFILDEGYKETVLFADELIVKIQGQLFDI